VVVYEPEERFDQSLTAERDFIYAHNGSR
jgi:hypothetical protein